MGRTPSSPIMTAFERPPSPSSAPSSAERCTRLSRFAIEGESAADPEALATHWKEAGHPAKAAEYAAAAGAQALKAFAFDRAVRWYEQALSLLPQGTDVHLDLRVPAR